MQQCNDDNIHTYNIIIKKTEYAQLKTSEFAQNNTVTVHIYTKTEFFRLLLSYQMILTSYIHIYCSDHRASVTDSVLSVIKFCMIHIFDYLNGFGHCTSRQMDINCPTTRTLSAIIPIISRTLRLRQYLITATS